MELTWENANNWIDVVNEKKECFYEPKWNFDCGFKLDFDGSILRVNSRFYPPNRNKSNKWEGSYTALILNTQLIKKDFVCETLDELHIEVEKFHKHYSNIILSRLS